MCKYIYIEREGQRGGSEFSTEAQPQAEDDASAF